jgi:hypothetical protein
MERHPKAKTAGRECHHYWSRSTGNGSRIRIDVGRALPFVTAQIYETEGVCVVATRQ